MDHKPLEKLGHLHSKMMNRFQTALLEHNFVIQYKKGSDMPVDYLSRLSATSNDPVVAAFNPFQPGLDELQQEEEYAQNIFTFHCNKQRPNHLTKKDINQHLELMKEMLHSKDSFLWIRLTDYNYPQTALLLSNRYQKEALCQAHNSIFGGHDATLKTYMKILSSYYWPRIYQDVKKHVQTCLTCQQRKQTPARPTALSSLPIPY
jgi:hypothetical protein